MSDLIHIIGAGVMGRVLAFHLRARGMSFKIYDAGHGAALNSMPFVSSYGILKGVSPLGDLLAQAFIDFEEFFSRNNPQGVYEVSHFVLYGEESEKMCRRFGPPQLLHLKSIAPRELNGYRLNSYLIDPKIFLNFLYPDDLIEKVFLKNEDFSKGVAKTKFFCTSSLSSKLIGQDHYSKVVAGAYLQAQVDLGEESFIMTSEDGNLLYYHQTKTVCLGATTESDEYCLPDIRRLEAIKKYYSSIVPALSQNVLFSLIAGLRLKGKKRHPRFLKISEGEYLLDSFYKNGFSLPFFYVKEALAILGKSTTAS